MAIEIKMKISSYSSEEHDQLLWIKEHDHLGRYYELKLLNLLNRWRFHNKTNACRKKPNLFPNVISQVLWFKVLGINVMFYRWIQVEFN